MCLKTHKRYIKTRKIREVHFRTTNINIFKNCREEENTTMKTPVLVTEAKTTWEHGVSLPFLF